MLCYTDGLTELEDEKKHDFGPERLAEFAKENYQKPVEQFNNDLVDYLVTFKGKQLFSDDISVLSCRFFAKK